MYDIGHLLRATFFEPGLALLQCWHDYCFPDRSAPWSYFGTIVAYYIGLMAINSTNQEGCDRVSMSEVQLVVFSLRHRQGKIEFGVPIERVQEINRLLEITRLPQYPDFIEGVVNLRGQVIPVIDLRRRLGIEGDKHTEQTRIIVFNVQGSRCGVIVDEVSEVLRIHEIDPPPSLISGVESHYLEGVARVNDRLILLISLEEVFTASELKQLATPI